jgi:hypothetical protein
MICDSCQLKHVTSKYAHHDRDEEGHNDAQRLGNGKTQERDAFHRSDAFTLTQLEAILHHYRDARLDADLCLSVDRLYAYAAVLDEYTRENQLNGPSLLTLPDPPPE